MSASRNISFILNQTLVSVSVSPTLVALDYLRKRQALTGTKEGCKEGDCGACSVVVGELVGDTVRYRPMTSCLLPMGELHGKHLVSIEGLNGETLSPIQAAMLECGGTQCGYCTPGFIVAMTAGLMDDAITLDKEGARCAISGNLCRCTGYRSIKEAGEHVIESLKAKLIDKPRLQSLCETGVLPPYFLDMPERLQAIPAPEKAATPSAPPFVAGGTDLFVQQGETLPNITATLLNSKPIEPIRIEAGRIVIDARETFEGFARNSIINEALPDILEYNEAIASWPIRERATLGGNLCNASPIADMTCLLLALESHVVLETPDSQRSLPLAEFYLGYKKLAKEPEEILTEISFQSPDSQTYVNWEKVSKRRVLDIATVNSAAKIQVVGNTIAKATLSLGGVAATPLILKKTSQALAGLPIEAAAILEVISNAQAEFDPISDVRGSGNYKRLLARQLLLAHFTTLFPEQIEEEALYASLR